MSGLLVFSFFLPLFIAFYSFLFSLLVHVYYPTFLLLSFGILYLDLDIGIYTHTHMHTHKQTSVLQ